MCGIVGYIGSESAAEVLVDGLKTLEYRGYDSAGVAVIGAQGLDRRRAEGKLKNLSKRLAPSHFRAPWVLVTPAGRRTVDPMRPTPTRTARVRWRLFITV